MLMQCIRKKQSFKLKLLTINHKSQTLTYFIHPNRVNMNRLLHASFAEQHAKTQYFTQAAQIHPL